MKLAYILDQRLPNRQADTQQVMNTLYGLGTAGVDATLFLPKHFWHKDASIETLWDYYQLPQRPNIKLQRLRSLQPSPRLFEKWSHALTVSHKLRNSNFDLFYTRNLPTLIALIKAKVPAVYETYRPWPEQYPWFKTFFQWVGNSPYFLGAVFHSHYARQAYLKYLKPQQVYALYNGYNAERFKKILSVQEARNQVQWPSTFTITYAGRVRLGKGLDILLSAAELLREIRFVIIGSEGKGEVEKRAASMPNVEILGWKSFDDLVPYLYASDVLVIPPSLKPLQKVGNTVLPIKVYMYLAAQRPILAPRAPDTAELLHHDRNAWLVPPGDLNALVQAIRFLRDHQALRRRLGQGARQSAQTLTWEARGKRLKGILERFLVEHRSERI